jgi:predicted metal-dependent phosphoesterase TrpH
MIDLHTHSTASDGTLEPEAVVELAAKKKLAALALTDHDTVAGVAHAAAAGRRLSVEVVPGVEISVHSEIGALHLLGYFVQEEHAGLQAKLAEWCGARRQRARRIVEKLAALGFLIPWERLEKAAGSGALGRPHVARELVRAKAVRSVEEAFERYLRRGRPAYVSREMPEPEEAIALIRAAGGVAVLAHPATLWLKGAALEARVKELRTQGLAGVEVHWSGHSARQRRELAALAKKLSLVATGGSDFHGDTKPGIQLGSGRRGNVRVSDDVLKELRERAATA